MDDKPKREPPIRPCPKCYLLQHIAVKYCHGCDYPFVWEWPSERKKLEQELEGNE